MRLGAKVHLGSSRKGSRANQVGLAGNESLPSWKAVEGAGYSLQNLLKYTDGGRPYNFFFFVVNPSLFLKDPLAFRYFIAIALLFPSSIDNTLQLKG